VGLLIGTWASGSTKQGEKGGEKKGVLYIRSRVAPNLRRTGGKSEEKKKQVDVKVYIAGCRWEKGGGKAILAAFCLFLAVRGLRRKREGERCVILSIFCCSA